MAKKKKQIVPANKPISAAKAQDLVNKGAKKVDPILFTKKGLELIAMYAISNKTTIRGAITGISRKFRDLQRNKSLDKGVLKTTYSKQVAKTTDLPSRIAQLFPQGITSIKRLINEHEAVEQALYSMGILEDADPDLSKLRNEIREKGLDKRSTEGKEKLAILERGGQPAVIGRKKDVARGVMDLDDLVRDEKVVLPYRYKFNKSAVRKIITGNEGRELIGLAESIGTDKIEPTAIKDENLDTPTQKLQEELQNKKRKSSPVDEELNRLKNLKPEPPKEDLKTETSLNQEVQRLEDQNKPVKEAESKLRTLLDEIKKNQKYGSKIIRAVPFVGAGLAAIEAFYGGEADARTTAQKTADAVNEGIKVLIAPDITQMGSGTLTNRDPEALRRAMQPRRQGESYE